MRISGKKHCNAVKISSLVLFAFLLIFAGTAFADDPLHVFYTGSMDISLGSRIAGVGDINQDGHDDYLVGVPEYSGGGPHTGAVHLVSGADGSQLALFEGENSSEQFGFRVACAGDLNLDGVNDFLIASRYAFGYGAGVFVYSGADGVRLDVLPSPLENCAFGDAMVGLGDKNGDGIPDFAIASPDAYGDNRGAVYLYSGAPGEWMINLWTGDAANGFFGQGLAAADIEGDGSLDLVISAPYKSEWPLLSLPARHITGVFCLRSGGKGISRSDPTDSHRRL